MNYSEILRLAGYQNDSTKLQEAEAAGEAEFRGRPAEEKQVNEAEHEGSYQGSEVGNEGAPTTQAYGTPGRIRITHGDQSQLVDPMAPQQGTQEQQQPFMPHLPPLAPEIRQAWPFMNDQQRMKVLQMQQQVMNQASLNAIKLSQGEQLRLQRMKQAEAAVDSDPTADQATKDAQKRVIRSIKDPLEFRHAYWQSQLQEQQVRNERSLVAKAEAANQQAAEFRAKTLPQRIVPYQVTDEDGNTHTVHLFEESPGKWREIDHAKAASKTSGAAKGHGDFDPVKAQAEATKLLTTKDADSKTTTPLSAEAVKAKVLEMADTHREVARRMEEDKLPGLRDDKGERGKIREAALQAQHAHPTQKKLVMKALAELDRIAQLPRKALQPSSTGPKGEHIPGDVELWNIAKQIAAPYLPAAEVPPIPESMSQGGSGYHPVIGGYPERKPETVIPAKKPAAKEPESPFAGWSGI